MAFLKEPRLLIIAKANIHARVHRRVYLDYIGIKRFDASGNLVGEQRIVGLFTSTAYTRSAHSIPYLRRKIAGVEAARRLRSPAAIPARRWPTCWSIIRATNCSRSTRTRSIISRSPSCSSTSGRACACWRGATASTASCRCWCSCRANATTATSARSIGDYLSRAFIGRVSAFYPFFPEGPLVRVHFIIGRSGGHDARGRSRDAGARGRGDRAHVDRRAQRRAGAGQSAGQGARVVQPLSRCVLARLPGGLCAGGGGERHPRHRSA